MTSDDGKPVSALAIELSRHVRSLRQLTAGLGSAVSQLEQLVVTDAVDGHGWTLWAREEVWAIVTDHQEHCGQAIRLATATVVDFRSALLAAFASKEGEPTWAPEQ